MVDVVGNGCLQEMKHLLSNWSSAALPDDGWKVSIAVETKMIRINLEKCLHVQKESAFDLMVRECR
jgi:hypothetical protein